MIQKKNLFMGIDAGTQSCRVGIFDLEGLEISSSSSEYPTFYPNPGWSEQDAIRIWDSLCKASRNAIKKGDVDPEDIVGIGIDATCSTVLFCDGEGEPLQNAILWSDIRASEQAEKVTKTDHEVLKYSGGKVSPESMTAKSLWVKENKKKLWNKTDNLVELLDWLTYKMTGRWTASTANAAYRWNYVSRLGGWSNEFFESIGLEDVFEKWPNKVLFPGEKQGILTKAAADEMGLESGIPVAEGCNDANAGTLGLDALKPGRVAIILGSSTMMIVTSADPVFEDGVWVTLPNSMGENLWLNASGEASTGAVLEWFRDQIAHKEKSEAEERNKTTYEILDEKASDVPVGSEGLIVLEHWQGSRIYGDSLSRGNIHGLTLKTTRAQIFRAMMEACAYSVRHGIECFRDGGVEIEDIRAAGGGTRSPLLLQIHADVAGIPIYPTGVDNTVCLGSAMLGSVASGHCKDLFEAGKEMSRLGNKINPKNENHEEYNFYYENYKKTYSQMKKISHEVVKHSSE